MKDEYGREVLVSLALPLPLSVVPELLDAVGAAAEKAGYCGACHDWTGDKP